jgi:hypothetical protein
MKTLQTCFALVAFATMVSLQAAEKDTKTQASCSDQPKATCSAGKSTCSTSATTASSCCSAAKVAKKRAVDVKGAVLLAGR